MTPTPEQAAIIEAAKSTSESLLISALAGSAKTTTLELIVKALPISPILSLAFNKKIADEMSKRLPGHVTCRTMNALGHRVWGAQIGKRLQVDSKKSFNILKSVQGELKIRGLEFGPTLRAISAAKLNGYIPRRVAQGHALITAEDFFDGLDDEIDQEVVDLCLARSINQAYAGAIDFDDQIYMPTLFGGTFPRFPLVLIDEAQDLSELNHCMLEKLVTNRLIAVGDPYQSIYGFRGAVSSGMEQIKSKFNCRELPLSVSFRCPQAIVLAARKHAPHFQWFNGAPEGEISSPSTWTFADPPDGAAIICRNNAPLFRVAMKFIQAGRGVRLVGSDIGPGLVRILKKFGNERMTRDEVLARIQAWQSGQRKQRTAQDKADCLRVFTRTGETLGQAIAYAEHLFNSTGPVNLLTGHKAKGLEWDTVFYLDSHLIPSPWAETAEELEQERNIDYVILTRARQRLVYVNSDDLNAH